MTQAVDSKKNHNFALVGAGGYIAPRHLKAIKETGNQLIAASDPNDSVGVLDQYFPQAKFFTEIERFDRYLEKARRQEPLSKVDYVSICSPNYLHDAHIRLALRLHAHAICEKPLTINPWNLLALQDLEDEFGKKVYTVLQLRLLPALVQLKRQLESERNRERVQVSLSYVTRRGPWYHQSWKGNLEKSGGIAMNIGIHFFDLVCWIFGKPESFELHLYNSDKMAGLLRLERADVKWFLSIDENDLPQGYIEAGKAAYRSLTQNGVELDFSSGFTDLHTEVYRDILIGNGFGIKDALPSIELVSKIRGSDVVSHRGQGHHFLSK
jgi:UDP-N-acetyl-2-amino-2-deoxyglucuronate dehydrogenase